MTSYNKIEKVSYSSRNDKMCVNVLEYISFADERLERKYCVIKFQNNLDQNLKSIKFEVTQFDENDNIIEKSVLEVKDLFITPNEIFVPNLKFKTEYKAKSLSFRLVEAVYDKTIFVNDHFEEKPFGFDEYLQETNEIEGDKEKKSEKKAEKKQETKKKVKEEKKNNKKKSKNSFVVKELIHKNRTKFPYVFSSILSILLIGFMGFGAIYVKKNPSYYSYGNYDYHIVNEYLEIISYNGSEKKVVIPEKVNGIKVHSISTGAFKNRKITSIEFTSDVIVNSGAFNSCKSLQTIISGNNCEIYEYGFRGCTSLKTVYLPESIVYKKSFYESDKNIQKFVYGKSVSCDIFGHIFGLESNEELKDTLESVCFTKEDENLDTTVYLEGLLLSFEHYCTL